MSLLGSIATAAACAFIPGVGIALAIWKLGKDAVLDGLGKAAKYLLVHPMTAVAIIAALLALFEWQDARHWKKVDTGHVAQIASVKVEVDRGVCQEAARQKQKCKPTDASNAPAYIRGFVDNLATVTEALGRQTTALNAAKLDADAHNAAAHQAAQPTEAQGAREKVRQKITDPARTTGLTADEWGKL